MSQGILVKNDSGHILVSSDIRSFHYLGQARRTTTVAYGLTSFPDYTEDDPDDVLSGRRIWRYKIETSYTPIFFIMPSDYNQYHGVLNQYQNGTDWYCEVIGSGNVVAPEVFAFTDPRAIPTPSDTQGVQTFLSDGTEAFDSRKKPLAIVTAAEVIPPEVPCDGGEPTEEDGFGWNDKNLDHDFTSDDTYNSYSVSNMPSTDGMMFAAPSIAQAVYSRVKYGFKRSCSRYQGCQDHWSTAIWWAMYHQGYKLLPNEVRAGWCVYTAGYYFYSAYEDGGWFGGGSGSAEEGDAPYNNKTINRDYGAIIIANASDYL